MSSRLPGGPPAHSDPPLAGPRATDRPSPRTGGAPFWTPLRFCLLFTTSVLALGWLKQVPCAGGTWKGVAQYVYCYNDTVPLFTIRHLDTGALPYLDSPLEYPVLSGGLMALAAALGRGYDHLAQAVPLLPMTPPVHSYYVITCLLLSLCALLLTRAVLALAGRRPWDAAMVGLSPLLFVHAFTNWDLFAVALAAGGMWAWARWRPVLAGVLIGLGVAAKLYPALLLIALFLLCLRTGRLGVWLRTAAAAGGAWVAVNAPVALVAPENWRLFFTFHSSRPVNPDTMWNMLLTATHYRLFDGPQVQGSPTVLNAVVAASLILYVSAVGWLTLAAPVRPRVAQVAFLLLAGFLLLNKVWSPQYSLWLLPLAVLALPRWRLLLLWQAAEALLWVPITSWSTIVWASIDWSHGPPDGGVKIKVFFLLLGVRNVVVVVLMGLVARDVLRPDRDVVRTSRPGVDDPAGGPLDRAPDRLVVRGLRLVQVGSAGQGLAQQGNLLAVGGGGGPEDDRAVRGARRRR